MTDDIKTLNSAQALNLHPALQSHDPSATRYLLSVMYTAAKLGSKLESAIYSGAGEWKDGPRKQKAKGI